MIQDVGDQMFERFTGAMRAQLEAAAAPQGAAAAAEPIQALSFGAGVAGRALGRTVRRPAFWIAGMFVLLVVWWLLH
jgi:hypothetical protein